MCVCVRLRHAGQLQLPDQSYPSPPQKKKYSHTPFLFLPFPSLPLSLSLSLPLWTFGCFSTGATLQTAADTSTCCGSCRGGGSTLTDWERAENTCAAAGSRTTHAPLFMELMMMMMLMLIVLTPQECNSIKLQLILRDK